MSVIFYVSYIGLWLLVLFEGVLLLLVYRHFGLMALGTADGVNRDGLPIGEVAPTFSGVTSQGEDVAWVVRPNRPHLLLFASPDCEPCARILPYLNQLSGANVQIDTTVVVPGRPEAATRLVEKFASTYPCLAEDGSGAFNRYRVRVTPFAFVVGGDGRILAKGLCSDPARLRSLLLTGGLDSAAAILDQAAHPVDLKLLQSLVSLYGTA